MKRTITGDSAEGVHMDPSSYFDRLGLDYAYVADPDLDVLETLQGAHVTAIPFETLAITGDPHGHRDGDGVSLDPEASFEKLVERERGGFCYELNGSFGALLDTLGYDVQRRAAMVITDGDPCPPANHLTHVVDLDRRYVVDVGLGVPALRTPLPLDGEEREDEAGVAWRVTESDRPDTDYAVQYREPGGDWDVRYVFADQPRDISYVEATCDYLTSAPESPFTGDPVVSIATDDGYRKLGPDTLTRSIRGETTERDVDPEEWYDLLDLEFNLAYP
jgi:N-hydroxyarylamine O-acetyltransferase